MTAILIGIGIGLLAGVLSGLFGVGGGIVMVPALVLLGLTQREASGTSLAALVAPVAIFGVIEYARRHEIRVPYAIGLGIGLAIGAFFGARLAGKISNVMLMRGFGALMLAVSIRFLFFAR
ncbi:MAG TPA: sulfite exporter TauE/SafE family protein [Actinomycetota bacterium]|nr:sulfite exporter TauE/SafE family protein [Actinomycetota bacterium]